MVVSHVTSGPLGWKGYHLLAIQGADEKKTCMCGSTLIEATQGIEGKTCDVCQSPIRGGEDYWRCSECAWEKCISCHEDGTCLPINKYIKVTARFEATTEHGVWKIEAGVIGKILSTSEAEAEVLFSYHLCRQATCTVSSDCYHHLSCVDTPKPRTKLIVGALSITILFLFGIFSGERISLMLKHFIHLCRSLGWWAPVLMYVVSSILPVIMLPVFPMMALSGPLFTKMYGNNALVGGTVAFVSVFCGLWTGSVIAFALGKTLFKDFAVKASEESLYLQKLNNIIDSGGTKIVLMARSLPILPAEVFDYACALTTLTVGQYAIGCLGSAVPVAFWTYSSAQAAVAADDKTENGARDHMILIGINICMLVLLSALIVYIMKQQDKTMHTDVIGNNPEWAELETMAHQISGTFGGTSYVTAWKAPADALEEVFAGIDRDNNGSISVFELNQALTKSKQVQRLFAVDIPKGDSRQTASFFSELISKFDKDGDGQISKQEFMDYFFPRVDGLEEDSHLTLWPAVWKVFNTIDENGDGKISIDELASAMATSKELQGLFAINEDGISSSPTADEHAAFMKKVMEKFDTDGDGTISFDELLTHFQEQAGKRS